MSQERLLRILLGPVISEKSTLIAEQRKQIAFHVEKSATKNEIKQAVEKLFDVKVKDVHVINVKAKTKQFRQRHGKQKAWKKAYVSLQAGYDINFASLES